MAFQNVWLDLKYWWSVFRCSLSPKLGFGLELSSTVCIGLGAGTAYFCANEWGFRRFSARIQIVGTIWNLENSNHLPCNSPTDWNWVRCRCRDRFSERFPLSVEFSACDVTLSSSSNPRNRKAQNLVFRSFWNKSILPVSSYRNDLFFCCLPIGVSTLFCCTGWTQISERS